MEPSPKLGFLPHPIHSEVFLEHNALVWQHLYVKLPEHLGDKKTRLAPRQGHTRARPRPLAEWMEVVSRVVFERGIPLRMVLWQPALGSILVRVVKIVWAACKR